MPSQIDQTDAHVQSLVTGLRQNQLSRRQFLERGAVLLGSLAAANSLLAACTLGSSSSADAPGADGLVDYPGPGEGYLAQPEGDGPFPAVVVVQEWWGLDDHIKSVADRFAREGFVALAPDLYHGQVATEPDEARKLAMEMEQDVAIEEIQNAVNFLVDRGDVTAGKAAVVGFCMGGGLALQMAAKGENVAIVAPFYGRPLDAETAAEVKVPVIGSYGEEDESIPTDAVRQMANEIEATGQPVFIEFYPAGHAFFNDTRESYNADAAADAWQRVLGAFRAVLV